MHSRRRDFTTGIERGTYGHPRHVTDRGALWRGRRDRRVTDVEPEGDEPPDSRITAAEALGR